MSLTKIAAEIQVMYLERNYFENIKEICSTDFYCQFDTHH